MTALNPLLPIGLQITESLRAHLGLQATGPRERRAVELLEQVGIPGARAGRLDQAIRTSFPAACASGR